MKTTKEKTWKFKNEHRPKPPEIGSIWVDFANTPHKVTHTSMYSVTSNVRGKAGVNMKTAEWNAELRPLDIDEQMEILAETTEAKAEQRGEYWADSERNGD